MHPTHSPISLIVPFVVRACAVIEVLLVAAFSARAQASTLLPITKVEEVRALTRKEAAEARPVQVRGVVNWAPHANWGSFFFADESGGIYVQMEGTATQPGRVLQNDRAISWESFTDGFDIEVDGVTSPGGYAPVILAREVRIVGKRAVFPPRKVSVAYLQTGSGDSQHVQLERLVVQSVAENQPGNGARVLRACSATGNYILISVTPAAWNEAALVVDAEVVVTGIVLTLFNSRQELTGLRLGVARQADFEIVKPPSSDAFAAPRVAIGGLRLFRADGVSPHRRAVEGTVTMIASDGLVIQEKGRGLEVRATPSQGLQIGDRVRIAGFVEARQAVAYITNGLVKKLSNGSAPAPLVTTPEEILKMSQGNLWRGWDKFPDDFDHRLVRMEGMLISSPAPGATAFTVQTATGQPLKIQFANGSPGLEQPPATGSLLDLTGVALVQHSPGKVLPEFIQPTGLELLLRGPKDVAVVRSPPWWDARRLFIALSLAALVIAASALWIFSLRRLVTRQGIRLHQALRVHRDSELEFSASQRERLRLAHDLHDGFQQLLTGAMFRLNAALNYMPDSAKEATEQLKTAQNALQHTQSGLRNVMWGLSEVAEGPPDFTSLLRQAASRMDHWQDIVEVRCNGPERPISDHLAGSLLMIFQEAVGNAIRHGHATNVDVEARFEESGLALSIHDNGSGFDPSDAPSSAQGHFGISGMRERMRWLGGTLTVTSQPDQGAQIIAFITWDRAEDLETPPVRGVESTIPI